MSSSDSEDTPGSLCDFIVDDSDYDEENDYVEDNPQDIAVAAAAVVAASLVPEPTTGSPVLRRSTRTRRAPQVYVDENFAEVFFETKEEIDQIMNDAESEEGGIANDDMDDEDYEFDPEEEEDDEYEEDDDEEYIP